MKNPVTIMDHGELLIVRMEKLILVPIVRTPQEEQTTGLETIKKVVERAQRLANFDVCINGVWYDYNYILSVANRPANTTVNEGEILLASGQRMGVSSEEGYYAAQRVDLTWEFGFGNLPSSGFRTGVGGLCPLIINGLPYGVGNIYKAGVPKGAPEEGEPAPEFKKFLIQRNSRKFTSLQKMSPRVGKSGFGVTKDGVGFVVVQPHYASRGVKTEQFRDVFINLGCIHAMKCDGSDSVFMYRKRPDGSLVFECSPGEIKNNSMTQAIGFKSFYSEQYLKLAK
jgi:hypothetical protein